MVLDRERLRSFYDRFGSKQDTQGFYEDAPLNALVSHCSLDEVQRVLEVGCGTGRFADSLLSGKLAADTTWTGIDLSSTMVELSRKRLARWGDRVSIRLTGGDMVFPAESESVDLLVCNYVLDLLPGGDIEAFFTEAGRVLRPGGQLGTVTLTIGNTPVSRVVSSLWKFIYRLRPGWVGGCRPVVVDDCIDGDVWSTVYSDTIVSAGIPSAVRVLIKRPADQDRPVPQVQGS